jgi:hypothetical protein
MHAQNTRLKEKLSRAESEVASQHKALVQQTAAASSATPAAKGNTEVSAQHMHLLSRHLLLNFLSLHLSTNAVSHRKALIYVSLTTRRWRTSARRPSLLLLVSANLRQPRTRSRLSSRMEAFVADHQLISCAVRGTRCTHSSSC